MGFTATTDETVPRLGWARWREIGSDGAVLVRPDRHIAWRSRTAADDPQEALATVLGQILAQPMPIALATAGHAHDPVASHPS